MRFHLRHAVVLAVLLGSFMHCMACSSPGPHSKEELVRDAETIVLAKVVAGTLEHFGNPDWPSIEMTQFLDQRGPGPQVTFEVVRTLKGTPPAHRFALVGSLKYFGPNQEKPPYDLARPGAQHGMCFAFDYRLGGTFLLLLKNGSPHWSAVRPTNEEVFGMRDRWLVWVETQVARDAKARSGR